MTGALACAVLASAACSTQTDDRPMTIQYISSAILGPTCGEADCHSSFAANFGDVFDTLDATRHSLVDNGLIRFTASEYDPANPAGSYLLVWLTTTDPFNKGYGRMPLDGSMPNEDIIFLEQWIEAGAPGAECDPTRGPKACNDHDIVACESDWSFGAVQQTCPNSCAIGSDGVTPVCQ